MTESEKTVDWRDLFDADLLFTSDKNKEILGEWTRSWHELTGRHPFFLLHGSTGEFDERLVGSLKLFREDMEHLCPIDIFVDSPGGEMEASFKAAHIFQSYCNEFRCVVPRRAKSGGTLFADRPR